MVKPAPAPPTPASETEEETETEEPEVTNRVPNTLTPEETAQGWKLLFDGKRLLGWKGVQKSDPLKSGWKIGGGELNLPKEVDQMDKITGGDLMTTELFWDFDLRFEWRATVSANSGIRYLVNVGAGQAPVGLEYQIIDDVHHPVGLKGGPIRQTGSLDNVVARSKNARLRVADPINKVGDPWNEGRIVVQGNKVEHWLNGQKILEFTLGAHLRTAAEKNYKRDDPFALRPHAYFGVKARTPIVIVDQGTEVAFRSLRIRPLTPAAAGAPAGTPAVAPTSPLAPGTVVPSARPNAGVAPTTGAR